MGQAIALASSLGAAYLGVVVSSFLFGVTTLQVYIYYQYFGSDDKLQNRIVVPLLWVMDAFHIALAIHAVYFYLVHQLPFIYIIWSMRLQLTLVVLIAVTVTSLYALRIWYLAYHPRRFLLYFLVVAQLLELTAGFLEVYTFFAVTTHVEIHHYVWKIQFALASHAAIDCFLAITICYYLQTGRTGFSTMDTTVFKLIINVMASGVATSVCALAILVAITMAPSSQIWVAFYCVLSKLYVNSFLAVLNARRSIRKGMEESPSAMAISDVRFAGAEANTQTPSECTGSCRSDDIKGNVPQEHQRQDIDVLLQSSHSLTTFQGAPSREGLAEDDKHGIMVSATV